MNAKRKRARGGGANVATEESTANTFTSDVSNHVTMVANANALSCYAWLADTGTTSHIACDKSQFSVYQKTDRNITGVGV